MAKNNGSRIGNELMNQLNNSPIDLLTTPIEISSSLKASSKQKIMPTAAPQRADKQSTIRSIPIEKERITVQINKNTIERVKDCVYWNRITVAQFVEEALKEALLVAEKQNGKPFQKRRSELKPGRPLK